MILGPDGKPAKAEITVCPQCGSGPDRRTPSGGFGEVHLLCLCGYDFEKELKCQPIASS